MLADRKKKEEVHYNTNTRLQCLDIDIKDPLSICDWKHMSNIVSEIDALAWIQVLPVGQKASQPFQFNCIHILPSSKIPFPKIPLDSLVASRINYIKKRDKRQKAGAMMNFQLAEPTKREEIAESQAITVLPEFQFPHGIFKITPSEMTADGLQYSYSKLSTFLGLKDKSQMGVTIVVSPQWMFVATINQPYHVEP